MIMGTLGYIKNASFFCENCDYITDNKTDFARHKLTLKHKNGTLWYIKNAFACQCGKNYKYSQGLSRHKKICTFKQENGGMSDISNNIIIEIVKQNQEFKQLIVEQNKQLMEQYKESQEMQHKLLDIAKEGKTINNNVTNNKFNLQIFLNEKCKDALNIMDFVNSLKMKLTDLETFGKLGYSEGISAIFIRGLKELDIFKRPIHCSDLKREIMYVRDKDTWEKEKNKIKLAIDYIAHQNVVQIPAWIEKNPDAMDYETKKHSEYIQILSESMGGKLCEDNENKYNKIMKNIAKEVLIEKC
jgi:hypothetical protein